MSLSKEDKIPRSDRVLLVDTKTIDLDRALINLFMLIKHQGRYPVSRTGVVDRTAKKLMVQICEDITHFPGFTDEPDLTQAWLEADFLDLVSRGTAKEALAAPRPIHLNAYKLRNAKHCRDYGAAPQLYRLLDDEGIPARLKTFLLKGCDPNTDKFQGGPVDIETLLILRLADKEGQDRPGQESVPSYTPLCTGQARLFRNDIRRLLRYESIIPRTIWVEYFKTLCGLHLALYIRHVAAQVNRWMRDRQITNACRDCPVDPQSTTPRLGCPFGLEFLVDMGNRNDTRMAALSQASAEQYFHEMEDFIRNLMGLTKLIQYTESSGAQVSNPMAMVERGLQAYAQDDPVLKGYCQARLNAIVSSPDDRFAQVRSQFQDDPFRAYVECILLERFGFHRKAFRDLFRSVLSPNKETGLLVGGQTARSASRFHLGTRLLETLVQIAVLRPGAPDANGQPRFQSEPMLISDLLFWLRRRYGIAIGAPQVRGNETLSPADLKALRANEEHFKNKLREIGFFTDLSDASNAQRVSPRYPLGVS